MVPLIHYENIFKMYLKYVIISQQIENYFFILSASQNINHICSDFLEIFTLGKDLEGHETCAKN